MATVRKVLGQANVVTVGPVSLYTVPAGGSAVISTLVVVNLGAANAYSVRIRVAGAAADNKQYLFYGQSIAQGQTIAFTAGITLAAGDIFELLTNTANASGITFTLFGEETT